MSISKRPVGHPTLAEQIIDDLMEHDEEAAAKIASLLQDISTNRRDMDTYSVAILGLVLGTLRRNINIATNGKQKIISQRVND